MAETVQMVAAVVSPVIWWRSRRIEPAPRKPTPVTIWAAMRAGSCPPRAGDMDTTVKMAEPTQIRICVRRPAGLCPFSRSMPTMAPQTNAIKMEMISHHGVETTWCRSPRATLKKSTPPR